MVRLSILIWICRGLRRLVRRFLSRLGGLLLGGCGRKLRVGCTRRWSVRRSFLSEFDARALSYNMVYAYVAVVTGF